MTTYYLIRHAEKERNGQRNPHLTSAGKERAKKWAAFFTDKNIEAIYCTPLVRTQETAQPLADQLHLPLHTYFGDVYTPDFNVDSRGKTVLIVGHQDTTPANANRIIGRSRYEYIDNHHHNNLYKITVDERGQVYSEMTQVDF